MFLRNAAPGGLFLVSFSLLLAQPARNPEQVGRKALDLLLSQKFAELSAMFSDSFKQTVTLDFLQQRVAAELKEFGQLQNVGQAVLGADRDFTFVKGLRLAVQRPLPGIRQRLIGRTKIHPDYLARRIQSELNMDAGI